VRGVSYSQQFLLTTRRRGGYQTCNAIGVRAFGIKMGLSCVRMRPCN